MARNTGRRQQNRPAADWNHFYVYGSAVRQPEALPSGNGTVRKPKKKRTSRQVIKNRHRAQRISPAYATFLIVAAVCAVFICVMYLRLQADVLNRADQITALQRELTDLGFVIRHLLVGLLIIPQLVQLTHGLASVFHQYFAGTQPDILL